MKSDENGFWLRLLCLDSAIQFLITILISRALCSTDFGSTGAGRSIGKISRFRFSILICDFNCLPLFLWFLNGNANITKVTSSRLAFSCSGSPPFAFMKSGSVLSAVTQSGIISAERSTNRTRCKLPTSNES